jgi:hypothetical protein
MNLAEQQAKNSGFYHFDRQRQDLIHVCGKVSDSWIDKINAYYTIPNLPTYDIKFNQIYTDGQKPYDDPDYHKNNRLEGLLEIKDTLRNLQNAGYTDDYVSFQCSTVPVNHPINDIGKQFPFKTYNTRFSIVHSKSVSIYHFDHNFEAKEDGSKQYYGGFHEDIGCRKFLIALDNIYDNPGNCFFIGNAQWNWRKGDIVPLDIGMPHYGANFSEKSRAFFMVMGIVDKTEYDNFCKGWNEIK